MKISIHVKPGNKVSSVEQTNGEFTIRVKAQPVDGKANQAVIDILAEYLAVRKSDVKILSGFNSRRKIVQLPDSVQVKG